MVEVAIILPLLLFILIASTDFARAFHDFVTITDSARNGSLFASQNPTLSASTYQSGITSAALADTNGLGSTPVVSTSTVNVAPGESYVNVNVTSSFNTIFDYPGIPSQVAISRTIQMRVQPTTYRMK